MPRQTTSRALPVALALVCVAGHQLFGQGDLAFDLDVPEGHTEPWVIDRLDGANRLEAEVEIRELRRDVRWRPVFNIMLRAADREIVLHMVQQPDSRHVTVSVLLTAQRKTVGQQSIDGWRIEKGQRFQVSMDWSRPGVLSIAGMGRERGRFILDFVPTSLRVSASTGRFIGHKIFLTTR